MIDSVKEQLLKIKALAERGVSGEKDTAARMLNRLMEKHGLTLADLSTEVRTWHWFSPRSKSHHTLLLQVVAMVCKYKGNQMEYRQRGKKVAVHLTAVEAVDVQSAFGHFRKEWDQEQKKMLSAFIQRHRITAPHDPESKAQPMSMAELEDLLRRMGSFGSQDWQRPTEQLAMGGTR